MNPWLPPCERVGGERHANLHLRSSRGTVRGEVRWREVGGLLGGSSVAQTTGPTHTMDRRPSAVLTRVLAGRAPPSTAKVWGQLLLWWPSASGCLPGYEPPGSLLSGDGLDNPDRTATAPPRPTAIDLDLQPEAQERPDQHDQLQDGDVLQRGLDGDGPTVLMMSAATRNSRLS